MDGEEKLKRQKEFLVKFAYWAVWAVSGMLLIKFIGPVLLPFAVAFLIAWLLYRPIEFVTEKTHLKRNLVAVSFVILFYALIGTAVYFAGSGLMGIFQNAFTGAEAFLTGTVFPMLSHFFEWFGSLASGGEPSLAARGLGETPAEVTEQVGKVLSGVSGNVISKVSGAAICIPEFCMKVLIAVIATVFMELDFRGILSFLKDQIPEKWQKSVQDGKKAVIGTMGKCMLSYGLILFLTFVELTAGFLFLGIEGAVVIALVIAALDILPVLGTGTILIPWTVIAIASGDVRMGVGILGLYLVITVVRNIVEPRLVGKQMGLSPVVMLPCMLVGLKFFGLVGLIGLPFAVSFLKNLNDKGIIHIFKNRPEGEEDAPPNL